MNDFFAKLFEVIYLEQFSDDMYDLGLYFSIGMVMFLLTIASVVVYYYAINSPKFNQISHWLIAMLINGFLLSAISLGWIASAFDYEGYEYSPEYLTFTLLVFVYSLFLFFGFSALLKRGSRNCSRVPF